ncbi:MAG: hypothetical protein IT561_20915 [Alphaproteobacteria bacterium]|nr:hypothetical protein [Alphaproteobacteria bacterium]
MLGLFGDSHQRLFAKELKERGVKIARSATKEIVAAALTTVPPGQHAHAGTHGRNIAEDAVLHFAAWTATVVNRTAGRPTRVSAIDPDLYPETEALLRGILVKHGVIAG